MDPGKPAAGQRAFAAMVIDFAGDLLQFPPGLDRLLRIQPGLAHGGAVDEQYRQGQPQRQAPAAPAGVVDRIATWGKNWPASSFCPPSRMTSCNGRKRGREPKNSMLSSGSSKARCGSTCLFSTPRKSCNTTLALALLLVIEAQYLGRQDVQRLAFEIVPQADVWASAESEMPQPIAQRESISCPWSPIRGNRSEFIT
jgi:hypothetical protein